MALALLNALLYGAFRRSELWMRQHVVKLGWLLTHDRKAARVFYCAAFLPGILLRIALLWLGCKFFRARDSALASPPINDSKPLPQGYFGFACQTNPVKRAIIETLSAAVGIAILWWIAVDRLDAVAALGMAGAGGVDAVAAAVTHLMSRGNVWLWIYLSFCVANTLLPPIPENMRRRAAMAILVALLIGLGISLEIENPSLLAATVDSLLQGIALIMALSTLVNLALALALGTLEALIEAVTGHSATIRDGNLITMTRQEARQSQPAEPQAKPDKVAVSRAGKTPRSLLDLPLPVPGPPGVEPVSKRVAAVVRQPPPVKDSPRAAPPVVEVTLPPVEPAQAPPQDIGEPGDLIAPFERPFAPDDSAIDADDEDWDDDDAAGFARPFSRARPKRDDD